MRLNFKLFLSGATLFAGLGFMTSCANEESLKPVDDQSIETRGPITTTIGAGVKFFYGLSSQNELVKYTPGPPVKTISTVTLQGLRADENMVAIDFRYADGQLYGVSNQNMLYVIEVSSGFAKPISRAPFDPVIDGGTVGFDFDPVADQIRLVTDNDQNIRIDPNTGEVVSEDTKLSPEESAVNSIAYSLSRSGGLTLPLYDIDAARGMLLRQAPHNDGTLLTVGSLGLAISGEGGFDIASSNNVALAALYGHSLIPSVVQGDNLANDDFRVYQVNLTSGKATYKGKLDRAIIGLAIP